MASCLRRFAVLLLVLAPLAQVSAATLVVSAVIPARASVQMQAAPSGLSITSEDVARGYVDAQAPMALLVRSNSLRGVMLEFNSNNENVQHTTVDGLGTPVQYGQHGGSVLIPSRQNMLTVSLKFRFHLTATAAPGFYAWPIQVAAAP